MQMLSKYLTVWFNIPLDTVQVILEIIKNKDCK